LDNLQLWPNNFIYSNGNCLSLAHKNYVLGFTNRNSIHKILSFALNQFALCYNLYFNGRLGLGLSIILESGSLYRGSESEIYPKTNLWLLV